MTLAPLTERDFQRQVTELAELLGWQWVHFRKAMNARGKHMTPVSGPLGKGWPDLVLVRERDRRLIFAELKRDSTYPTPEQRSVMATLDRLYADGPLLGDAPRVMAAVWRPRDWDEIERTLR